MDMYATQSRTSVQLTNPIKRLETLFERSLFHIYIVYFIIVIIKNFHVYLVITYSALRSSCKCVLIKLLYCILCLKNNTDVAHYNFNKHQPILVIFGKDVAEEACCQTVILYFTSPT